MSLNEHFANLIYFRSDLAQENVNSIRVEQRFKEIFLLRCTRNCKHSVTSDSEVKNRRW